MAKSAKLQAASSSSYDVGENIPLLGPLSPLSSALSSNAIQDGTFRVYLYNVMTHRHSSHAARLYSFVTFSLVIVSVAFYVVRSLPQYWPDPPLWLWLPESICFALLFIFQVIRFSVSRRHCETLRDPHTTLTLLAIVPFVLDLILSRALHGEAHHVLSFVRFLEVFRVLMVHISPYAIITFTNDVVACKQNTYHHASLACRFKSCCFVFFFLFVCLVISCSSRSTQPTLQSSTTRCATPSTAYSSWDSF